MAQGDLFVLTTDGVYDHVRPDAIGADILAHPRDLDQAARAIAEPAYGAGSPDNLTVQIVRVDALPAGDPADVLEQSHGLPPAPVLELGATFDGYAILRTIHSSSRSHVYLARDAGTGQVVVLKVPSTDMRDQPGALKRFMMKEWAARRLNSPHVLKAPAQGRTRNHLYVVLEHVNGQTLAQWMLDHPAPALEAVRGVIE